VLGTLADFPEHCLACFFEVDRGRGNISSSSSESENKPKNGNVEILLAGHPVLVGELAAQLFVSMYRVLSGQRPMLLSTRQDCDYDRRPPVELSRSGAHLIRRFRPK